LLGGGTVRGEVPEHLRTYRLCVLLKKVPSELENESAVTLDWLLAIDNVYREVRAGSNGDEADDG